MSRGYVRRVRRRLGALRSRPQNSRETPAVIGVGDAEPVLLRGQLFAAQTCDSALAPDAEALTYSALAAVLDAAGVPFAVVSQRKGTARILAIREQDWTRAWDALAAAPSGQACFIERTPSPLTLRAGAEDAKATVSATVFSVYRDRADRVFGRAHPCELQSWSEEDGLLTHAHRQWVPRSIDGDAFAAATDVLTSGAIVERRMPDDPATARPAPAEIDAVVTWVDGSDPAWRERRRIATGESEPLDPSRYRDNGELRFAMRSLAACAPWIRTIHLVTDHQVPRWLDLDDERVRVHFHEDFFADPSVLPTFNSRAIGSQLHRIDGLAERYLIVNDDVFFAAPTRPEHFFTDAGLARVTMSRIHAPIVPQAKMSVIDRARDNAARLVESVTGTRPNRLFAHAPIPQTVSLGKELEARFPEAYAGTTRHRVRSADDVETNSWLQLNFALQHGRAIESELRFGYVALGDEDSAPRVRDALVGMRVQVLCVNDTGGPEASAPWLEPLLERAFPERPSWELDPELWRAEVVA